MVFICKTANIQFEELSLLVIYKKLAMNTIAKTITESKKGTLVRDGKGLLLQPNGSKWKIISAL